MANDPNDPNDPKEPKPTPEPEKSPPPAPGDSGLLGELPELDLKDFNLEELPELAEEEPPEPVHSTESAVSFDPPVSQVDPASTTGGVSLEELARLAERSGLSKIIPSAEPASGELSVPEAAPASGEIPVPDAAPASSAVNLEPVVPVKPASGWLDSDERVIPVAVPAQTPAPPDSNQAAISDAPAVGTESSDIFASQRPVAATPAEHSDVIAATAFVEPIPDDGENAPPRPSEVALSFDQPPGGSTVQEITGSDELLVAEELVDHDAAGNELGAAFDSAELAETPPLVSPPPPGAAERPDFGANPQQTSDASSILADFAGEQVQHPSSSTTERPDFGANPQQASDASSILADLAGEKEPSIHDSSAVKLEAPGVSRTFGLQEGTEFDLTISDDDIPPELAEAEANLGQVERREPGGSDLFSHTQTTPEVDLDSESGRVIPVDPTLEPDDPSLTSAQSSIFSDKTKPPPGSGTSDGSAEIPLAVAPPGSDEDSAVEFSSNPVSEDEEASSRIFGTAVPPSPPIRRKTPHPKSSVDFEMPEDAATPLAPAPDDDDLIDWDAAKPVDEDETLGLPRSALDAPTSGILQRGRSATPGKETPAKSKPGPTPQQGKTGKNAEPGAEQDEADPSVEIDWLAGSSSEESILNSPEDEGVALTDVDPDAPTRESGKIPSKPKDSPAREPASKKKAKPEGEKKLKRRSELEVTTPRRGGGGWVGGTLLGMAIAGGACAAIYFGGLIPNSNQARQGPPVGPGGPGFPPGGVPGPGQPGFPPNGGFPPGAQVPTAADALAALKAGDAAKAKAIAESLKDATPTVKALVGETGLFALVQEHKDKGDTPIAADNPNLKAARENLQALVDDAEAAKTAEGAKAAVKAAIQLGISHEIAGERAAAKKVYTDAKDKFPKFASTFDAALYRLNATTPAAPPMPDGGQGRRMLPADAQQLLFAITLLQADTPTKDEETEAGVYFWKAVNKAAGEKYADAVDEIKKAKAAHAKQAKAMAGRGLNPLSDPLEQIFLHCCDDLKAYWELKGAIYDNKAVADLIKKDGANKAMTALATAQKKAGEAMKLMADLKEATDKLTISVKDLKDAKDLATKLDKDVKAAEDAKLAVQKKLDAEEKARKDTDTARQKSEDFIASLAKELQTAKLLPEKFDNAELLAAQKKAAERASGPNLTALLPNAMTAVGGAGLSAAQLLDIADRMTKAETAAKTATDKLASETKKLATERAEAEKKLKDDFAADLKKLMDTNATNTTKLKDEQAAELKKMSDKYIADTKKLTADFESKIKELQTIAAKEKERADTQVAQFKKDLGNAIGPAQALDLWLPLLVELRRPSDTDAALATATKVLESAPTSSEDWAKARTVAGLCLLYKNEFNLAKAQFQAAKSSPVYEDALKAKKLWATAADVGLESVSDPLAPYRVPPELPKRDPAAAARFLDTGVRLFKEERYADAVTALTDSTKADPTNPVAWYFLGAARWDMGSTDAAKDDFRQGAAREAASPTPTRLISGAIAPIQGPARDALTAARP
jgi:hypothetical protein